MIDFSAGAGKDGPSGLIPANQLAFAILNVRGVKPSRAGGQYIDIELTIDEGQPYGRKKLWDMIGDPSHPGNSEDYREMGMRSIARILEAGRGAGPNNVAAYTISDYSQLSGLRVAIKIGVTPAKDGYEEKNKVAEYLTPNPQSAASKDWARLLAGEYNKAAPAPAANGFGAAQTGGFGSQQPATQAAQTSTGWGQPAAQPAQQWGGFAQPGFTTTSTTTSPSEAGPGWLAQANGG